MEMSDAIEANGYMTLQPQPFFSFGSRIGSGDLVIDVDLLLGGSMGGANLGDGGRAPWGIVGVSL